MSKICFLNPFGTDVYDPLIEETVAPSLRPGTELVIRHLVDYPANMDYFVPKHLAEVGVLRAVIAAERDGFDAFVIGCCYDPGLTQARELTSMPVIGPLEASVMLARLFGHRFSVVTDIFKAVPELDDRIRMYGLEGNCRSVSAIDWFITDMVGDPDAVARDAYAKCKSVIERDGAEAVVIGCTIVAACYERALLNGASELADITVINPNLMAIKLAELFADLNAVGQYRISRRGYYQQQGQHNPAEANEILALLDADAGVGAPAR